MKHLQEVVISDPKAGLWFHLDDVKDDLASQRCGPHPDVLGMSHDASDYVDSLCTKLVGKTFIVVDPQFGTER